MMRQASESALIAFRGRPTTRKNDAKGWRLCFPYCYGTQIYERVTLLCHDCGAGEHALDHQTKRPIDIGNARHARLIQAGRRLGSDGVPRWIS